MQNTTGEGGDQVRRGPELHDVAGTWQQAVRERRRGLGLTQVELADLAGVAERTVIALEKGAPGVAVGNLVRVLDALGLELTVAKRGGAMSPR